MPWPAVGVVGGAEACAAAQPATGGGSRQSHQSWFGRLEQEDQILKKEHGRWINIQRLSCFFNLSSSCSRRSNKRRRDCLLPPPAANFAAAQASQPHRTPIAGQAIPLLTHKCCYSPATADEPVNPRTPPRGKQLPSIPWLHIAPFLGLAVVHRHGALRAAWSTWSRNDFHRKSTVVERLTVGSTAAARKCLLIMRKIIIPPPDSGDPPDEPPVFYEKNHFPLIAGTHRTGHCISQKSVSP